jgi:hypothetical protein
LPCINTIRKFSSLHNSRKNLFADGASSLLLDKSKPFQGKTR